MDIIILIMMVIIIYNAIKESTHVTYTKFIELLKQKKFSNIDIIIRASTYTDLSADFHGDNYFFRFINPKSAVTADIVLKMAQYSHKNHFHNTVIVVQDSIISDSVKKMLKQYYIEIWDERKLKDFSKSSADNSAKTVISKMPIDDNCIIDKLESPIQYEKNVNSILGNFFKNKIDRL